MPTLTFNPQDLRDTLETLARDAGFDAVRVTHPDAIPDAAAGLRAFLAQGHHGEMAWMARNPDRRAHPNALWSQARSVIMLGMNYAPDTDPLPELAMPDRGYISVYARNADYHDVIKKRLKRVARALLEVAQQGDVKVFVDTAPLMEKPLAAAAGIGWQGRHTNLVSREFGSWLFLGAIVTSLQLLPDAPEHDHCGSCRACLDICPTDAFPAPYQLDARKCISYLTIEHKGVIPRIYRRAIGNRIYGCDDCLAVCPWNKFATTAREAKLRARDSLTRPSLTALLALNDLRFRSLFKGSPIRRIGRDRFIRNVLIAAGNALAARYDAELCDAVKSLLKDESPLVRAMAVWALVEIDKDAVAEHMAQERDSQVRAEWEAGDV